MAILTAISLPASAKKLIQLNNDVTTHIVMPEDVKMVDVSTAKIIGNQCADNIVRIKPNVESDSIPEFRDGDLLGTVTLIGERNLAQYDVRYTSNPVFADAIFHVSYDDMESYVNPEVLMPKAEMAKLAWAIYSGPRKYNQLVSREHGMKAVINNIYSIGDFFFIDYSLYNNTKISYDIAEVRVKLTDKKEIKATNSQTIELTPAYNLNNSKTFKKNYRNVLVLPKLTFPDEKVLKIEISENQISGRVINLTIDYKDILHADCFESLDIKPLPYSAIPHIIK